jgi:hypothetical protein
MNENDSNGFVSNNENQKLYEIVNEQIKFKNGYRGQQFQKIIKKLPESITKIKIPRSFYLKIPINIIQDRNKLTINC